MEAANKQGNLDIVDASETRNEHDLCRFNVKCTRHYQLVKEQHQQLVGVQHVYHLQQCSTLNTA